MKDLSFTICPTGQMEHTRHALVILILLGAILLGATSVEARTARHHRPGTRLRVWTVVRISNTSITNHSKSQNTDWTVVIYGTTTFLTHGHPSAPTRSPTGSSD